MTRTLKKEFSIFLILRTLIVLRTINGLIAKLWNSKIQVDLVYCGQIYLNVLSTFKVLLVFLNTWALNFGYLI